MEADTLPDAGTSIYNYLCLEVKVPEKVIGSPVVSNGNNKIVHDEAALESFLN